MAKEFNSKKNFETVLTVAFSMLIENGDERDKFDRDGKTLAKQIDELSNQIKIIQKLEKNLHDTNYIKEQGQARLLKENNKSRTDIEREIRQELQEQTKDLDNLLAELKNLKVQQNLLMNAKENVNTKLNNSGHSKTLAFHLLEPLIATFSKPVVTDRTFTFFKQAEKTPEPTEKSPPKKPGPTQAS